MRNCISNAHTRYQIKTLCYNEHASTSTSWYTMDLFIDKLNTNTFSLLYQIEKCGNYEIWDTYLHYKTSTIGRVLLQQQ